MATIRLMLADDHPLFREGVKDAVSFETEIQLVAEASTAHEAVRLAEKTSPTVVLMDARMPVGGDLSSFYSASTAEAARDDGVDSGVRACGLIKERTPACRVVMLTTFDDAALVISAVRSGADGFLLKTASRSQIVGAVRSAANGETPFAAEIMPYIVRYARSGAGPDVSQSASPLTERELEVLRLLATGLTNHEIGDKLVISTNTVNRHVSNILMRMNVRNRTEAVLSAASSGLLTKGT